MKKIITIFLFILVSNSFPQSGWVYQPLPVNANSYDMKFFDANTGVISLETPALLRTTNGGQNWIIFNNYTRANNFDKINDSILYAVSWIPNSMILRTFNKGATWDSVSVSTGVEFAGLSFINKDTGWVTAFDGSNWRILKTTNGGVNYQTQVIGIGSGQIFFLKYKINGEYYGWVSHYNSMYKTTNSGVNWFLVGPAGNLKQLNMIDTSTGWASNGSVNILKTTNGGLNWVNLHMPIGNGIVISNIDRFKIINVNKVYGVGGTRYFGSGIYKGIVWVTTNGGLTWGFQQPDTTITYGYYGVIDFVDSVKGWCEGIHTTDGGGIITKISNNNEQITNNYILYQNYPNPFNAISNIKYQIANNKFVTIKIYNITGKEITTLVNKKQNQGIYEIKFDGINLSSGVYFYSLFVDGVRIDTKKLILLK